MCQGVCKCKEKEKAKELELAKAKGAILKDVKGLIENDLVKMDSEKAREIAQFLSKLALNKDLSTDFRWKALRLSTDLYVEIWRKEERELESERKGV